MTNVPEVAPRPTKKPVEIKTWVRKHGSSILRTISRIVFFLAIPSFYISAYMGLIDVVQMLKEGTFMFSSAWPSIIPLAATIPVTILAGRFFCGWMCAFGAFTDLISTIGYRVTRRRIRITDRLDVPLRYVKYILLVALICLAVAGVSVTQSSPWDSFGMLFTPGTVPNFSMVLAQLLPGAILLLGISIASFFIERFFCRYLCPLGAVFAIFSFFRPVRIEKPRDACGKCKACTRACAMGIRLSDMDSVKSVECISCMKCVEICPRKNASLHVGAKKLPDMFAAVLAVLIMLTSYLLATYFYDRKEVENLGVETSNIIITMDTTQTESTQGTSAMNSDASQQNTTDVTDVIPLDTTVQATDSQATSAATADSQYSDGTYRGTGFGFRGEITVDVTISGGSIAAVSVVSSDDDAKYFDRAYSKISSSVIDSQSTEVDAVSGATYSSDGLLDAINDALAQAKSA